MIKKIAYVFKDKQDKYNILLSHCFMNYDKHEIDDNGIPVIKTAKISKEVKAKLSEYDFKFGRPRHETIRKLQANIYEQAMNQVVDSLMLYGYFRNFNIVAWKYAIEIWIGCFNFRYLKIQNEEYYEYMNLTIEEIYHKLLMNEKW